MKSDYKSEVAQPGHFSIIQRRKAEDLGLQVTVL